MEIIIKGDVKEFTALALELQERLKKFVPSCGKEESCTNPQNNAPVKN